MAVYWRESWRTSCLSSDGSALDPSMTGAMLGGRVPHTGERYTPKEDGRCVTLCKPESHILLLRLLSSTYAVSLVRRAEAGGSRFGHEQAWRCA